MSYRASLLACLLHCNKAISSRARSTRQGGSLIIERGAARNRTAERNLGGLKSWRLAGGVAAVVVVNLEQDCGDLSS